jgi:general secretion pathway protein G
MQHMFLRNSRLANRAFTLIEIMVVVIVIAILAAFILPNIAGTPEKARAAKAQGDIADFSTLLEAFKLDLGRYPTQDEGLQALRTPPQSSEADRWKGPYLKKEIPKDPWGNPYVYTVPCPNGIDDYGIESLGRDGQPGGEGFDADINSWASHEEKKDNAQ